MTELALRGLDGANPLGFLTALGALRTATLVWPQAGPKLAWVLKSGTWRPTILGVPDAGIFVSALAELLSTGSSEAFALSRKFPYQAHALRKQAVNAQQTTYPARRTLADFIVAYGCEALVDKDGNFADTALRMLRSADSGGSGMLAYASVLAEITTAEDIDRTLFYAWRYLDDPPSMRWDPVDDRRYALRWSNPSSDKITTLRGANRLAIEALPLLPTMPMHGRLETTAFTQRKGKGVFWTWPIWTVPATLDIVRSLLSLSGLQQEKPNRHQLNAVGVTEIYRCQRITQGKYRNFTPARPV